MDDDFLQAAAAPLATESAAMEAEEAMPQRKPHEPIVRDFLRIKVLSMGDGHTGKSCLIKRYCEQRVRPTPLVCFASFLNALEPF